MPENDVSDKSSGGALNKHNGQRYQNDRQHAQSGGNEGSPISAHNNAIPRDGGGGNGAKKTDTGQPIKHAPSIDRAGYVVAIATAVSTVLGLGTLIITSFQLNSMDGQLNSMNSQLEQMKIANELTKNAVQASIRQAKAAEDANEISRKALLSDRAWVYLQNSAVVVNLEADKTLKILLQFRNNGKAIARNFGVEYKIILYTKGLFTGLFDNNNPDEFSSSCMGGKEANGRDLIYPSLDQTSLQTQISYDTTESKNDILSGIKGIMILSCASYKTEGAVKHVSSCRIYEHNDTNPLTLSFCRAGNDAD